MTERGTGPEHRKLWATHTYRRIPGGPEGGRSTEGVTGPGTEGRTRQVRGPWGGRVPVVSCTRVTRCTGKGSERSLNTTLRGKSYSKRSLRNKS